MPSQTSEHVYELQKVRMSQDKDGHLVVFRIHPNDAKSPVVEDPCGSVFEGPLRNKNYPDVT